MGGSLAELRCDLPWFQIIDAGLTGDSTLLCDNTIRRAWCALSRVRGMTANGMTGDKGEEYVRERIENSPFATDICNEIG